MILENQPALRPPIWRSILVIAACVIATLTSVAFSELGQDGNAGVTLVLAALALIVPCSLLWRHRVPFTLTLACSGLAILLPVGISVAGVALVSLMSHRRGRREWWAVGAVTVATAVTCVRDVLAPTMSTSFLKTLLGPADSPPETHVDLSWWVVPITAAVVMGTIIAVGMLRRGRRSARQAAARIAAAEGKTAHLGDELARKKERERIAREVHDVLGHELSLLSLHAGALEVNAEDTALSENARQVRTSAAQSLHGLQSLLRMLREDPEEAVERGALSLGDLPDVVEQTVHSGIPVSSAIYIDGGERVDPALSRAVYRVVQELLTNARKYAPHGPIRLSVSGNPREGIAIETLNPYTPLPDGSSPAAGSGQGLLGISERVDSLDGTLDYGVDQDGSTYRVRVWFPWLAPD